MRENSWLSLILSSTTDASPVADLETGLGGQAKKNMKSTQFAKLFALKFFALIIGYKVPNETFLLSHKGETFPSEIYYSVRCVLGVLLLPMGL